MLQNWGAIICGIAGFIGVSKKPKATYEIMTNLFEFLEFRGTDASGVWAAEAGPEGKIFYHKEPIKSSEFIKKDFWKKVRRSKINLLLVHARATSKGNGHAKTNVNNHPFVSMDKRIGMIHNGSIEESWFLMDKFQCQSDTDSEVILRIFENGLENKFEIENLPPKIAERIGGIKDVWSHITKGAMAVAIGERDDDERHLFLFRNLQRPLWIADLRESLGQIIFFSTPEIWYRAVNSCTQATKTMLKNQKLIELAAHDIWVFTINDASPHVIENQFYRLKVDVKKTGKDYKDDLIVMKPPKQTLSVVTELDEEVAVEQNDKFCESKYSDKSYISFCKALSLLSEEIATSVQNSMLENTIPQTQYEQIIEKLEGSVKDLREILNLID